MCGDIRLTSGSGPSQYGPKTAPRREVVRKVHLGTSKNTTRRALHRGQHPGESLFGNWLYIRSYILGLRSGFDCDCFHLYFRRWLRRALLSLGVSIIRLYEDCYTRKNTKNGFSLVDRSMDAAAVVQSWKREDCSVKKPRARTSTEDVVSSRLEKNCLLPLTPSRSCCDGF
jgi:hypothetical protein